ncbi:MAG: hypothetical protein AAFY24_13525 [Pseudomonadota bacterium]
MANLAQVQDCMAIRDVGYVSDERIHPSRIVDQEKVTWLHFVQLVVYDLSICSGISSKAHDLSNSILWDRTPVLKMLVGKRVEF